MSDEDDEGLLLDLGKAVMALREARTRVIRMVAPENHLALGARLALTVSVPLQRAIAESENALQCVVDEIHSVAQAGRIQN